jgi:hypothetical protein
MPELPSCLTPVTCPRRGPSTPRCSIASGLRILTETENIDFLGSAIVTTEAYARGQRDTVLRFLRSVVDTVR